MPVTRGMAQGQKHLTVTRLIIRFFVVVNSHVRIKTYVSLKMSLFNRSEIKNLVIKITKITEEARLVYNVNRKLQ